jgi:gamma-glutamylcyclotransferase (GGCT)/AIG2-like uncharacterized protein YtfP
MSRCFDQPNLLTRPFKRLQTTIDGMNIRLFSYGTLRLREVQIATYGRELGGSGDALTGYRLQPLEISDPEVVRISGKAVHAIACASGDANDRISGTVFELTEEELRATDAYEVDVYQRVEAVLESGRTAWVYVGTPVMADRRDHH